MNVQGDSHKPAEPRSALTSVFSMKTEQGSAAQEPWCRSSLPRARLCARARNLETASPVRNVLSETVSRPVCISNDIFPLGKISCSANAGWAPRLCRLQRRRA